MADQKISALTAKTTLAGTEEIPINDAGSNKKTTSAAILALGSTRKAVSADVNSTSTTAASVTDLATSLAPGTYNIKLWLLLKSAATTTGFDIFLNASGGTVTHIVQTWYSLTTGTTATSGVMDQASAAATFQTMEGRAQRANNTSPGPFGGVDTANSDQFAVMEGIVVVTATTTLQVMFATEVAASQVTMQAGSNIEIVKVA